MQLLNIACEGVAFQKLYLWNSVVKDVTHTNRKKYNKPNGWVKGQLYRVEIEEGVKWGF